jgi:hypothetical protein
MLGLGVTLGVLWLLVGGSTLPVSAASFTVSTTADSGAGSLRQAIISANSDASHDTIDFDVTGVITLESPLPAIAETLTITGPGAAQLAVSGDGQYRVFEINSGVTVTITGLTVRDGEAFNGGGIRSAGDLHLESVGVISNLARNGGGVHLSSGSATLTGTEVISNSAYEDGGGVHVSSGSVMLEVSDGRIERNSAEWDGGGVYVEEGSATVTGVQVISNSADRYGGGVHVSSSSATLEVSGGRVEGNSAAWDGGGVFIASASATLTGTEVTDNWGGYDGGGMYVDEGSATLTGTEVVSNAAGDEGGGVYVEEGSATVTGVQVISNSADRYGGGVHVEEGSATLTGVQVISNSADRYGGGVCVWDGNATLSGGGVEGNSAAWDGGGVYVAGGSATLSGTQVISNSAEWDGGGVCVWDGNATLSGGRVGGNSAEYGGGVYVQDGSATLSGTHVISNSADAGGGVYVDYGIATLDVTGGSIGANSVSSHGGGVYVDEGSATLSRTHVISNAAGLSGCGLYLASSGAITATDGCIVYNSAPDLSIDKSAPAAAGPGDPVTYTLAFSNTGILAVDNAGGGTLNAADNWWGAADGPSGAGPGSGDSVSAGVDFTSVKASAPTGCPVLASSIFTATGVTITDVVPVSVTNTSVVSAADAAIHQQAGTRYVWDVGDLGWREGGTITITGVLSEPLAAGTFTNTAVIAATADGNPENDESSAVVTVLPPTEGTIVIEKATDPAGGTGFTFATDVPGGPSPFTLDHGQSRTFDDVLAGTYTVTETDPGALSGSPVLTDVVCMETGIQDSFESLATRTATIKLEGGETVTCTFTNALLDIDGDGVFNAVEDGAPNGGDGNDDGTPDREQGHVASLPNAEDGRYVTLETSDGTFTDVEAVGNPSPGDAPPVTFPYGFFSFVITGVTPAGSDVEVTLILPEDVPVTMEYWKHGPTAVDPLDHWYQLPLGDNDGDDVLTVTLTDGGLGDHDLTADSDVEDPGGPGQPQPVGGVTRPPSSARLLAPWLALAALVGLLAAGAAAVRRRRA